MKISKKRLEKIRYEAKIERICSKSVVGFQIGIFDLQKVHDAATKAFEESQASGAYETTPGLLEEIVIAKVRKFVETIAHKKT